MAYQDQESPGINIGPDIHSLARKSIIEKDLLSQIKAHPAYDESVESLVSSILYSEQYDFITEELNIVLHDLRHKEQIESNEEMMRRKREAYNYEILDMVVGAEEPRGITEETRNKQ